MKAKHISWIYSLAQIVRRPKEPKGQHARSTLAIGPDGANSARRWASVTQACACSTRTIRCDCFKHLWSQCTE
eukprot:10089128-Ditylum_brightwellii.AAC.1